METSTVSNTVSVNVSTTVLVITPGVVFQQAVRTVIVVINITTNPKSMVDLSFSVLSSFNYKVKF